MGSGSRQIGRPLRRSQGRTGRSHSTGLSVQAAGGTGAASPMTGGFLEINGVYRLGGVASLGRVP